MILSEDRLRSMGPLALAHMGDAVYEVLARREICRKSNTAAGEMHRKTVAFVSAPAQAGAAERILPHLTTAEAAVFRRGRNARSHSAPGSCTEAEYHAATGLEALFGWLYLREETERIEELFRMIVGDDDAV